MELVERLNVPLCQKTRIPVKTLVEQLEAEPSQRKLLEGHIASMYLVSLLNEQTMRIRSFRDEEHSFMAIYILQIELKYDSKLSELCELIHSAFPESTVLLLKYREKEYISCAAKRINKNDKTKTTLEDSSWVLVHNDDTIDLRVITAYDLKKFYGGIIDLMYALKVKRITGVYPKQRRDYKDVIKQYELLRSNINKLKEDYKRATMRSEKLRIDDQLYDNEIQMEKLIKSLKEEI